MEKMTEGEILHFPIKGVLLSNTIYASWCSIRTFLWGEILSKKEELSQRLESRPPTLFLDTTDRVR